MGWVDWDDNGVGRTAGDPPHLVPVATDNVGLFETGGCLRIEMHIHVARNGAGHIVHLPVHSLAPSLDRRRCLGFCIRICRPQER